MNKNEIMTKVSGKLTRLTFRLRKSSPEILIVAGVAGTVVSAVMACKATLKAPDILAEAAEQKNKIEEAKARANRGELKEGQTYTDNDSYRDTAIVIRDTGLKFIKLYGPSVALGVLSLTSIVASNNILRKRNVALAAAYATAEKSLKEYRSRVVERFGEQVDHELKHGIKAVEITEEVTDENGKTKKVKKTIDVIDPNDYSGYAKIFDETNPYYEKDSEYNLMFLRQQQQYANDLLHANGMLFLNDVYKMLGFEPTRAGQVVGWVYNADNPNGDNYVDFGIYDVSKPKARDFVNGYERAIVLDFNVDGNIWDLMK